MTVTVSAPGKLILCGEHTVVYGKPALLTAIDKRVYVTLDSAKENHIETETGEGLIKKIIDLFYHKYPKEKKQPLHIRIRSQIPVGVGLGSSAAVSVALIGALLKHVKNFWNPQVINELAYKAEKLNHGNPSGADNTISTFGGLLWYRKEFEFLKQIWSLPILSYNLPNLLLINTGKPKESTKEMIEIVAKQKNIEGILNRQEKFTKELLLALKSNDFKKLKTSIIQSEKNLEHLSVVGEKAKELIQEIVKSGGAAKISGAAGKEEGSGIVFAIHKNMILLEEIAKRQKYEYFFVKTGEEGVRLEKNE